MNFVNKPEQNKTEHLANLALSQFHEIEDLDTLLERNVLSLSDLSDTLGFISSFEEFESFIESIAKCIQHQESDKLLILLSAINKIRQNQELKFWEHMHKCHFIDFKNQNTTLLMSEIFEYTLNKLKTNNATASPQIKTQREVLTTIAPPEITNIQDTTEKNYFDGKDPNESEYIGGEIYPNTIQNPFLLDGLGLALGTDVKYLNFQVNSDDLTLSDTVFYAEVPWNYVNVPFGTRLIDSQSSDSGMVFSFAYFDDESRKIYAQRVLAQLAKSALSELEISEVADMMTNKLPDELKSIKDKDFDAVLDIIKSFLNTCTYNNHDLLHLNKSPEDIFKFTLEDKIGNCLCFAQLVACVLNQNGYEAYIATTNYSYSHNIGFKNVGHAKVFIVHPIDGTIIEFDPTDYLKSKPRQPSIRSRAISKSTFSMHNSRSTENQGFFDSWITTNYMPGELIDFNQFLNTETQATQNNKAETRKGPTPNHASAIKMLLGQEPGLNREQMKQLELELASSPELTIAKLEDYYFQQYPDLSDFIFEDYVLTQATLLRYESYKLPEDLPSLNKLIVDTAINLEAIPSAWWSFPCSITELEVRNCPKVQAIQLGNSNIKTIRLNNLPSLGWFDIKDSNVDSVKITACPNLAQYQADDNTMMKEFEIDLINPFKVSQESQLRIQKAREVAKQFKEKPKSRLNDSLSLKDYIDLAIYSSKSNLPFYTSDYISDADFNILKSFFDSELALDIENIKSKSLRYKFRLLGFGEKINIFDLFEFYFLLEDEQEKQELMQSPTFKVLFYLVYYSISEFELPNDATIEQEFFVRPNISDILELPVGQTVQQILQYRLSQQLVEQFRVIKNIRETPKILKNKQETGYEEVPDNLSYGRSKLLATFDGSSLLHTFKAINRATKIKLRKTDEEFDSLRKYQCGDDYKLIDHKASARTGEPMVRVYKKANQKEKIPDRSIFVVPFCNNSEVCIDVVSVVKQLKKLSIREKVVIKVYYPVLDKIVKFNFFDLSDNEDLKEYVGTPDYQDYKPVILDEMCYHLESCLTVQTNSQQIPLFLDIDCVETIYLNSHPGTMYKKAFQKVKKYHSDRRKKCRVLDASIEAQHKSP